MVIYGPTHTQFDEDLGVIMVQDCKTSLFCTVLMPLVDMAQTSIDRISASLKMVSYATMRSEMAMQLNSFGNEQQYHSPGAIRRQYFNQRAKALSTAA
jgi:hypothetical protein